MAQSGSRAGAVPSPPQPEEGDPQQADCDGQPCKYKLTFFDTESEEYDIDVLKEMSPFFGGLHRSGMRESLKKEIVFPTVTKASFNEGLAWVRNKTISSECQMPELVSLHKMAEMLLMQDLEAACMTKLRDDTLNFENWHTVLARARKLDDVTIEEKVKRFTRFTPVVTWAKSWTALTEEEVLFIIQGHQPDRYEINILKAVLRWLDANNADPSIYDKLLSFVDMKKLMSITDILVPHPRILGSGMKMNSVQEKLSSFGKICLVILAVVENPQGESMELQAWYQGKPGWISLHPLPSKLPSDLLMVVHKAGLSVRSRSESLESWWFDLEKKKWITGEETESTSGITHGLVVIEEAQYAVREEAGITTLEKYPYVGKTLYKCPKVELPWKALGSGVGMLNNSVLVVGEGTRQGSARIIIQKVSPEKPFRVDVVQLEPPPQANLSFVCFAGVLKDSAFFVARSGHLLKVAEGEGDPVRVLECMKLKDFKLVQPFTAVVDCDTVTVVETRFKGRTRCGIASFDVNDGRQRANPELPPTLKEGCIILDMVRTLVPDSLLPQEQTPAGDSA